MTITTDGTIATPASPQNQQSGIPTGISYSHSTDYPRNTVSWHPEPSRCVLLVHDMQDHFVNKYRPDAEPIRSVITAVESLITSARALGIPVVFSAQPGDQDPRERALLTDFWGTGPRSDAVGIVKEFGTPPEDEVMRKWRYSAFQRTDLADRMGSARRDSLIITGIYANIGCKATALDAFMSDFRAFMVADAVADFDEKEHHDALDWVARRCGVITTVNELKQSWNVLLPDRR